LILGEKYEGIGGNKIDPEVNIEPQQDQKFDFINHNWEKTQGLLARTGKVPLELGLRIGNGASS
jgi:hypothetical protein